MFEQMFGDFSLPARAIVALVLVLALIALTVWLMRRFGDGGLVGSAGGRGRQQRLAVLDSATVDARRKLVLIRRDNVEHLILIGGPTDVVVEPNIVRAQPAGGVRPASRPGTFEDDDMSLVPDSLLPEPEPAPAPARQTAPAPAATPPRPTPPAAAEPARTMPRSSTKVDPQYADMAQRLEAALRKPTPEPEVAARAPTAATPPAPAPRAPEPARAPEPRILDQRARAPMPRIPEAGPRPEPRAPDALRAPDVRPSAPAPRPTAPGGDQSAADVFVSLEEEMASLLRPGGKKDPNK
jgi:flagellar protein FliO/FliZ